MSHIRVVDSPNSGAKSDPKDGPQKKKQLKVDKGHNREISWPQRTKQNGGAHVLTDTFHKKWEQKSNQLKTWIESTFHPLPHVKIPLPQEGFPPQILRPEATASVVLHIHRCRGLDEPRDGGNVAVDGCVVQRCVASGAAARGPQSPQAEPNGTEGEKNSEKIWAPQSRMDNLKHNPTPEKKSACSWHTTKFESIPLTCFFAPGSSVWRSKLWKLWPLKIPKEHRGFEMFLGRRAGWGIHVAFGILLKACQPWCQSRFKHTPTLAKLICPIEPLQNLKTIALSCFFSPGSCYFMYSNRRNMAAVANEFKKLWFDLYEWDLHKWGCHIGV